MFENSSQQALKEVKNQQSYRICSTKSNWPPSREYRGYCINNFEQEEEEVDHENNECQFLSGLWNIIEKPVERSSMYTGEYKEVEFGVVEEQPSSRGIKVRS